MDLGKMLSRKPVRSLALAGVSAGSFTVSKFALVGSTASLISFLVVISFAQTPGCDAKDGLTDAGRLINQGCEFDDAGKVDEAISCYKKAMALEPGNDLAIFDLGNAYLNGKHDDATARNYIQQAVNLNPRDANYWSQLGLACSHLKDVTSAEAAFKRSIALAPDCGVLCNLAGLYRTTGRLKEARETVLKAKSLPEAKTPEYSKELQADLEWLDKHSSDKKTAGK